MSGLPLGVEQHLVFFKKLLGSKIVLRQQRAPLYSANDLGRSRYGKSNRNWRGLFRARNPKILAEWYRDHLGISFVPDNFDDPCWQQAAGPTVYTPFPEDTDYF
jgi:hypothetical protein